MKILLFGKNGQVGWELQRSLAPLGELLALDRQDRQHCGDLSNPNGIAATIRALRPNVIVNAAAYTAVDKAEAEIELANTINCAAPRAMAEAATECGAWLLHYSTDYVFNGSGNRAWREDDATGPLNVYGQTKLAGECAIQASACRHLIFRTSWVYAARGNNFVKTMLRLAQERQQLSVIDDQIGAPTGAELLADVAAHAIRTALLTPDVAGVYHLTAAGETSWYEYAHFALDFARQAGVALKTPKQAITAIPTSAYQTPAKRPLNSRLNIEKLQAAFDLRLPPWQAGVERMLAELYGK